MGIAVDADHGGEDRAFGAGAHRAGQAESLRHLRAVKDDLHAAHVRLQVFQPSCHHHAAAIHDAHVIGHPFQVFEDVGAEDHRALGAALAEKPDDFLHQLPPRDGIQPGRRFIQHQHLRPRRKRQQHRHLAPVTAAQRVHRRIHPQAEPPRQMAGEREIPVPIEPRQVQAEFRGALVGRKLLFLGHVGDTFADRPRGGPQFVAEHPRRAAHRTQQAHQHTQRGRLARAIAPDQPVHRAARHREIKTIDGNHAAAKGFGQIAGRDDGFIHGIHG